MVPVERHLFVAGCPRSGTSALTFLLNEHPRLAIGFERYKRVRAQIDPFHFTPAQLFSPVAAETDIRGELLYGRLRERWESGGVSVMGDKVPLYTRVLGQLLERFPGARVVVMVRDPLDVARSFRKRAADPGDWWPAENDETLAMRMWNEALAAVRAVDAEQAGGGVGRGAGWAGPGGTQSVGGPGVVALLPYEALFSGDEGWLEMLLAFVGVPLTKRLRAEHQRLAARWREESARGRQADEGSPADGELRAYVEEHRDEELARWAGERMERQLELICRPAAPGPGEDQEPLSAREIGERERERRVLLDEMRHPGRRGADEVEVLERRLLEQAGELARRGERLRAGAAAQPLATASGASTSPGAGPGARLRVTFIVPHQRATTGGVYVIEQFARHLAAAEYEVRVAVRERPLRAIPGVEVLWAERLDGDGVLPPGDVLVYPADMRDAAAILALPACVGRPVMLFQGYGTPGSPVVEANLGEAREALAIARWLADLALARGVPCAYVPQGLDRMVFAPGPPPAERAPSVSLMTHRLDWKGLRDALDAVAIVRARRPEVQVMLFGSEPVEGVGTYLPSPSRPEVAALLRSCAVHVVASWEEGFGLTGAEAIACGAALASTDTKGSRDYAIDGHTALVSPPRDPQALARNVLRLLEDAQLRTRLVTAGGRHLRTAMPPWEEAARRMGLALLRPQDDWTAAI